MSRRYKKLHKHGLHTYTTSTCYFIMTKICKNGNYPFQSPSHYLYMQRSIITDGWVSGIYYNYLLCVMKKHSMLTHKWNDMTSKNAYSPYLLIVTFTSLILFYLKWLQYLNLKLQWNTVLYRVNNCCTASYLREDMDSFVLLTE